MSQTSILRASAAAVAVIAAASLGMTAAAAQPFSTPPETVGVPATPATDQTTPAQPVSMRAWPNTAFPVIGTLRPGMPLQILASANYGWMQVQSPVGTGWVYGSYLASGIGGAMPTGGGQMPNGATTVPMTNAQSAPLHSNNLPGPEITSP